MSSEREHDPCALCGRFKRKDEEQAQRGYAWCSGYERYVHATGHPTPLFKEASAYELAERRAFLEKHKEAA